LRSLGETEAATKLDEKLIAVLERQLEIVPEDTRARVLLANTYARANKISGAIAETEKAVATRPKDSLTLYNAACTYGVLNMKPEALATFKRAIEAGYRNPEWAARDNDLACLHNNPEFQRLIKEHKRKN
jgi:non-specific serine/threonine protein kinase